VQELLEQSRVKSEFLRRERDSWGRRSKETQRVIVVEARLAVAHKRMAALHNEMADLRIRYDEVVTVARSRGRS
jgi:hypothetical protein